MPNPGDRNNQGSQSGKNPAGSQRNEDSSRNVSGKSQNSGRQEFGSQGSPQRDKSSSSQQASGSRGSDINLRLTPEQQAQVRQATGKNLQSLSLSVEDIEQGSASTSSEHSGSSSYRDETSEDERGMAEE